VIVVGGARYVAAVRAAWGNADRVLVPFGRERGQRSQGEMMRAMRLAGGVVP
jgi:hypothetical protein